MSQVDKENFQEETQPLTRNQGAVGDELQAAKAKKKKKIIIIAIAIVVVIGVILAIVLPLTLKNKGGDNPPNPTPEDPFSTPESNFLSMDTSTLNTSLWRTQFSLAQKRNVSSANLPDPAEFLNLRDSANGAIYRPIDPSRIVDSPKNNWANYAQFNIDLVDNYQARVQIYDNETTADQMYRRQVNNDVFPRPVQAIEARLTQLGFGYSTSDSFHFKFGNIYTGETIVTTENRKLLVSDYYSEIGFVMPTKRCFGLGQRNGKFQLSAGTYSLHARFREEGLIEDDQLGGRSGNHIHPFVLCQTAVAKDFFGIFFVSNAPQVFEVVQFDGQDRMVLNYITIGAPLEMYFMMRGKAQEIIAKYHNMIGTPQMPPYYALGVFQGSNSYGNLSDITGVFGNYSANNLSLEGVFIETYNNHPHWTYTVNPDSFANLNDTVKAVHANNQYLIYGTSYALYNSKQFQYYNLSIQYKCLVDSNTYYDKTGTFPATGILDNTTVQYVDAFHIGAQGFLAEALSDFNQTVSVFDGIIVQDAYLPNHIDGEADPRFGPTPLISEETERRRMLAISEETVGSYEPYLVNQTGSLPSLQYLPFIPAFYYSGYLNNKTINMNVSHNSTNKVYNLYVHNAHAHRAIQKTYQALTTTTDSTTRRPLLFTDASWAGTGAFAVALLTDLYRSWDSLRNVINQAIAFSMYGLSNTMLDVCGSLGPDEFDSHELCVRWMQLAAFMPMARNYYNATYLDPATGDRLETGVSEPFQHYGPVYLDAYRKALQTRLSYTRYIYSQMYQVHREGGSLVRPLFFDYPEDDEAYNNAETTYMLGDAIKVSPVLDKNLTQNDTYGVYFPQGLWINLNDPTDIIDNTQGGSTVNLNAYFNQTNVHLKGGKIIPYQDSTGFNTTHDMQTKSKMSFKVARDAAGQYAEGYCLIDDGISYRSYMDEQYTFWKIRYAENSINFWVQYGNFKYDPSSTAGLMINQLEQIEILNAQDLNETDFACYMGTGLYPNDLNIAFDNTTNVLTLSTKIGKDVLFSDIGFIKFGNSKKEPNLCLKDTAFAFSAVKNDTQSTTTYWLYNLTSKQAGGLIPNLIAEFQLLDDSGTLNVQITSQEDFESGKTLLYRVPQPEVYNLSCYNTSNLKNTLDKYVTITADPFSYSVFKDTTDKTSIQWRSDPTHLYFSKYFVMDSGLFNTNPTNGYPLLGMGERAGSLFYKNEKGAIHSRYTFDQANPIDDGLPPGRNFYGVQPFYAFQSNTSDWFGVFDANPYATDYIVTNDLEDGQHTSQIHKISIGGVIDKFFFIGSKVDDVIRKYQKLVGNPIVPPVWSFGWQQCRFGYVTDQDWWNVVQNYTKYDLPLDVMWADIDYMDDYKLFTISNSSYKNLPDYVNQIKQKGMHFVPIMDAGVAVRMNQGYKVLDNGLAQDVFIKRADQQAPLTAGVWCGNAYFPDFFKPATVDWWHANFDSLYDDDTGYGLKFDGIWLDENEATSFCNGYCIPEERPADSLRNKPFYVPGWRDLEDKTLGVDGWHSEIQRHEYDTHNLFSLMQTKATSEYLINKLNDKSGNVRPYVLTRGNFPGIGKYAHHWMGDNWSTVDYMAVSVDGVYSYNLFGLPFMGSDICGFNGDAAPDLCAKWHQLGSLYPFSRNHQQNATKSQEPFVFNQTINDTTTVTYTDLIRTALRNRYSLIKYYYSEFHQIGEFGGSFFKPLFYEFQDDAQTFNDQDLKINIMLGEALKASIQTTSLNFTEFKETTFYFPSSLWCPIIPTIDSYKCIDTSTAGTDTKTQTMQTLLEDYYVHIRGGYIIPYQDATTLRVNTTLDLEQNATDLIVLANKAATPMALPNGDTQTAFAMGFIYLDDGITTDNIARFDIYLGDVGDGTFTLNVKQMNDVAKLNKPHETMGNIYLMWATKSGVDKITSAKVKLNSGDTADLKAPFHRSDDTMIVYVQKPDGTAPYTFWDVSQIILS